MAAPNLGLPPTTQACLFDLDGVLTSTAKIHDAAWKQMFDEFLAGWAARHGEPFTPFDAHGDYENYVDGKPRPDGVRSFLASRGISLPDGDPDDPTDRETVNGLGNRKNAIVLRRIHDDGVEAYEGSRRYVTAVKSAGLRTAVVSSSANTADVLAVSHMADLFEVRVDGVMIREEGLPGKPAPDTFLAAARLLDVPADRAAVFEDALAGVEAGRAGGFGFVVGVDRVGHADALRAHGADIVVQDLSELLHRA